MKKKGFQKIGIVVVIVLIGIIIGYFLLKEDDKYEIETVTNYEYFKIYEEGKYGIIDRKATIKIEPKYDQIHIPNPSKDVFICYKGRDIEVRNQNNERILTQYEEILPLIFKEVTTSEIPYEKSVLAYKEKEKYGIINFEGKKITNARYDSIESLSYKEGCLLVKKENKYGVINIKGKEILKTNYDTILSDGYYQEDIGYTQAGFIIGNKTTEGMRYGYCNAKGKILLQIEFNEIERVTEIPRQEDTYITAYKNGKAGIYKGKEVIVDPTYEEILYNKASGLFLVKKGQKQGVINKQGKILLPVEQDIVMFAKNAIHTQKEGEKSTYTLQGEKQETVDYETRIETENGTYSITIENGKYGVVDRNNKVLIENQYPYIEYAFKNYFIVTKEGKVGVLDDKANTVIGFEYNVIQRIENTNLLQAIQTKNNIITLYNAEMQKIVKMEEANLSVTKDYIKLISNTMRQYYSKEGKTLLAKEIFAENKLFAFEQNGEWGFSNREGAIAIEAQYDFVTEFNKYGFAGIKKDEKWGVVDEEGNVIVEPCYEIEIQEPQFIGPYYQKNAGYGFEYYTNQEKGEEENV